MRNALPHLLPALVLLAQFCHADELPTLQRIPLSNEQVWQLEAELMGQCERNGAVLECLAETLRSLLAQAHMEPTVESLVLVLTTPSKEGTPQAAIKELLLPRTRHIQVSPDAAFALLVSRRRSGTTLEIFRDSPLGLTVQRMKR